MALAALIGCSGILIHSLCDFNLQIPANAALFSVLAGVAVSKPMSLRISDHDRRMRKIHRWELLKSDPQL